MAGAPAGILGGGVRVRCRGTAADFVGPADGRCVGAGVALAVWLGVSVALAVWLGVAVALAVWLGDAADAGLSVWLAAGVERPV